MEGMTKTYKVKIAGREFPLAYTMRTLIRLQEKDPDFDIGDVGKSLSKIDKLIHILFCMMEDAAKLAGRPLDFDEEWVALHVSPNARQIMKFQLAIIHTVAENMKMDSEDTEEDREVDLVLQEIQKKSGKTDSAGERLQPGD